MEVSAMHPIKVFYCYAHEDAEWRDQLAKHLSPLRRLRDITGWFDRDIHAGVDWQRERQEHLDAANIILLLISADFIASDYCYTVEMVRALERHSAGAAHVIPILLRPVEWERTPLGTLSPLPSNRVPVTQWANPDAAWLTVVQEIYNLVRTLLPRQHLSQQDADILYSEQGPLSSQTFGGKYLLGELIGEGGFSQVYKAQHLLVRRQQAIKVLHERHFRKPVFRDRFLREARTIAALEHPSIINLHDYGVEAPRAYLVMPYIPGGTLQDILDKQQGFLEHDQILFYLEHMCTALDYAHAHGVIHLDLKPLNFLVHEDGRLLLSDFGLAHLMKDGAVEGGSSLRVGTSHYMAPEHIQGVPEKRSDLFSLGIILYQMLVGRLPFAGLPYETILVKNLLEWPPAPRAIRPALPQAVEDILAKALAKQPELRYQTAHEMLMALTYAFGSRWPVVTPQYPPRSNISNMVSLQPESLRPSLFSTVAPAQPQEEHIHLSGLLTSYDDQSMHNKVVGERYQIQDPIGRGGMATIYRGRDTRLDRVVAIKVLREVYSTDSTFVTRFYQEAKAASSLQHPNIVQVYDYVQSDGKYCIVMERIEGADLRRYLRSQGVLAMDRAVIIAHDVALGLGAAHRRSIVHRDVKPQNIIVGRDGSIKLTDFGIADIYKNINSERLTPTGMPLGTVQYYAPEQAQGEIVSPAADIYALGIVMYEMATGRTPFDGDTPAAVAMQHIQDVPMTPSHLNPNVPPALEEIILRCLEKIPEMRFQDGNMLARALELLGEET